MVLAGRAGSPAWSPDGTLVAGIGVDVAEPLDDVMPGIFVAPSDGSRPPVALAPALDRPVGAWQFTDLERLDVGIAARSRVGWAGSDRGPGHGSRPLRAVRLSRRPDDRCGDGARRADDPP